MNTNFTVRIVFYITLITIVSCTPKTDTNNRNPEAEAKLQRIKKIPFGKLADNAQVLLYTLVNKNGVNVKVMNYGGIITSITTPDKNGAMNDIVLGYDSLQGYLKDSPYFGALIGRYGNRIAKGKFTIDGKQFSLAVNNGVHHLHGGLKGFDKVIWNVEELDIEESQALKLTYRSKDMEEGYPGNLSVEVIYTLTQDNSLKIDYHAITDKTTIVNLTQHTYFNLTGGAQNILSHKLTLNADKFLPVDAPLIPTGKFEDVSGSPFDFRKSEIIGERIAEDNAQIKSGNGYDHCWVLNKSNTGLTHAATLYDSLTGRVVETFTTEPGIQFYSGNFLDGSISGKGGVVYKKNYGLCLETQHFPNSPNEPSFPSVLLKPGETYSSQTVYKFSIK